MTKKETAVAVTAGNDLAEFKELAGDMEGLVTVRSDLLKIPRLKLTQKMSNVYGELAKEGDFASEVLGINYGDAVSIIPISVSESASLMDTEAATVVCYSRDLLKNTEGDLCTACPHKEYWNDWSTHTPNCKLSIDVVCLVKTDAGISHDPVEINFRKMNYKAGRSIINMIMRDKYGVPFGSSYKLVSKQATKDQYKFALISDVVEKTQLEAEEIKGIIPIAKNFLDMKKRGMVQVESEVAKPETSDANPPAAPADDFPL